MNEYELKLEAKRERLERAAERASAEAAARFDRARHALDGIEPGQPILLGHHSEGRHRAALRRHDTNMRKGIEAHGRAQELARRAEAVGSGGISSDDPDAIPKLEARLAELAAKQELMKKTNAAIRRTAKRERAEQIAALERLGLTHGQALAALEPDYLGRVGFPDYQLSNNRNNMNRIERRIKALRQVDRTAAPTTREVEGATITIDPGENRVFLRFPARLSREGYRVVRQHGFVWNRTMKAFSRKLTGPGVEWAAESVAQRLAQMKDGGLLPGVPA